MKNDSTTMPVRLSKLYDALLLVLLVFALFTTGVSLSRSLGLPPQPPLLQALSRTGVPSTENATATLTATATSFTTLTNVSSTPFIETTRFSTTSFQDTTPAPSAYQASLASRGFAGPLAVVYEYSSPLALVSWASFFGALVWRGHIRSAWNKNRFDYDVFRLLVRARGARTRVKLMHSLTESKNKLQLSRELGMDWKAVDRHVEILLKHNLVQLTESVGTTRFYSLTSDGRRILELLEELSSLNDDK